VLQGETILGGAPLYFEEVIGMELEVLPTTGNNCSRFPLRGRLVPFDASQLAYPGALLQTGTISRTTSRTRSRTRARARSGTIKDEIKEETNEEATVFDLAAAASSPFSGPTGMTRMTACRARRWL